MAEKTSGAFVAGALVLVIALAGAYVIFIHDWYWNHAALICTPRMEAAAAPADYCYVPDPALNADTDIYAGMKSFWGDDTVSRFFDNLSQLVLRWVDETIV